MTASLKGIPIVTQQRVPSRFERIALREIDLNITNRCNIDCRHCAFASHVHDENELPLELIQRILDEAVALGCREIHLTGGEPTIHRQFDAVLESVFERGLFTRLISNGTCSKTKLRRYHDIGLRHLLFSIDGMKAKHDEIRGRAGLFDITLARMHDALDLGYQVRINAVAMNDNLDELLDLYLLCAQAGVHLFSVFLYSPTGRDAARQHHLIVDAARWRGFKDRLRQLAQGYPTEVFAEKGFWFRDEPAPDWASMDGRGGGCYHLSRVMDYLLITGKGEVFPCALLNDKGIPYGNVHERSLADILSRPDAHYRTYEGFREADGKCGSCPEWEHCHGGCRSFVYAYQGHWKAPDPQCNSEPGQVPGHIPLCPLFKERLRDGGFSGFSESLSG